MTVKISWSLQVQLDLLCFFLRDPTQVRIRSFNPHIQFKDSLVINDLLELDLTQYLPFYFKAVRLCLRDPGVQLLLEILCIY